MAQYVETVLFKKYNLTKDTLRDRLTVPSSNILLSDQMLLWAYLNGAYKNMADVKDFVKGYNQDIKQAQAVVDGIFPLNKQIELAKTFHMRPPESGNSFA